MSSNSSDQDQRDFPRLPKEVPVMVARLEYPFPAEAGEPSTLKNIAKGGICLMTAGNYEIGTRLSLKINLKGWRRYLKSVTAIIEEPAPITMSTPLTAIAEVMWTRALPEGEAYEIGVKFLDIYEDEYNALKKYLETLANYSAI